MSEPPRKFDISWLRRTRRGRETEQTAQQQPFAQDAERSAACDAKVLGYLRAHPGSRYVSEVARGVQTDFEQVLESVLRLFSRQDLDIVQRDSRAGDHLVLLEEEGPAGR